MELPQQMKEQWHAFKINFIGVVRIVELSKSIMRMLKIQKQKTGLTT